jgi:3-methylcrotonyl-CoA carboxylase alpha subunit/acetyl-CoA/propionyl-CoA carboxylase biotin carboxyl carrier protein
VGYTNAGTVEFLVAPASQEAASAGGSPEEVFLLEMNTRLQVEHPVTELVTGLDLVQLQLRIAAGEPLPFGQEDITCTGHAFEARVYAEDAWNGFLPQAGVATYVRWSPRARVDAALESGSVVGTSYDPMLGKLIVHGPTREAARLALVNAIDDTAVLGLTTNLGFLRALAASDAFRDNAIDTAWLDADPDALKPPSFATAAVLAAWAVASERAPDASPFGAADGWRLGGPPAPVSVELGGQVYVVDRATGTIATEDATHAVRPIAAEPDVLRLEIDGLVHEGSVRVGPHQVEVAHLGHTFVFDRPDAFGAVSGTASGDGTVTAPMPGTVLAVNAKVGDTVAEGDVLGVMEAMKMELSLKAPVSGTVRAVGAAAGDQVALGSTLFEVAPAAGGDR